MGLNNLLVDKVSLRLKQIIFVLTLVIIFLPLVMNSNFFFPFIIIKNVFFHISVEIIFVAYLILAYLDRQYRPNFNRITLVFLAFVAVAIISSLFGLGFYRSFWGNYERMAGLFHLFHLFLFFFVLANVIKSDKDWHSFFTFSVFASLVMSFIAVGQWLGVPFLLKSSGGSRLSGTVGNPTFFAAYLLFHLFFLLYFFAAEKKFNLKLFSLSFLALDGFLIISSIFDLLARALVTNGMAKSLDWGLFNLIKVPFLGEAMRSLSSSPEYQAYLPYRRGIIIFVISYLIFQGLILLIWLFRSKKFSVTALILVSFIFEFIIFFNTQTRGAIIGLAIGIFILALAALFVIKDKKLKLVSLLCLLIILISPLALYLGRDTELIRNIGPLSRLATISPTNITTESRLLAWNASWQGWKETPKSLLIGYGLEHYYYAFNKYFPVKIYKDAGSQVWFDRAHNVIFDIGVTTGMIGLVIYLSLLIFAILALIKNFSQEKFLSSSWLWVGLIVAYFIQNFFVFDTLNSEIPFYLFLAFVVFLTGKNALVNDHSEKKSNPNYIYLATLVVVLIFITFAINVKTLSANNYIFQALRPKEGTKQTVQDSIKFFKTALEKSLVGRYEVREQLSYYLDGLIKKDDISPAYAAELVDYVSEELNKSIAEEPKNVRHYLLLATFYNGMTKVNQRYPQKAIELFEKEVDLNATRPQIYYETGQAYLFLNNIDEAIKYFNRGLALAPWVIDDNWNLLVIYTLFGKDDLAQNQYQKMINELGWQPDIDDYQKLVDLYVKVKKFDQAIQFQEKIIESVKSADNFAKLAALYAKIGNNIKARELTDMAVKIDPNFTQESEKFLQLLESGELLNKE